MKNSITVPELSLVTLIGVSGSGKSTFAKRLFKSTEIVSSDQCRGIVSDDENDQSATKDAFELLHYMAAKRLKNGLLTVVDATNIQTESRKPLINLAKTYHCLPVAIVLNIPEKVSQRRNEDRPDRNFGVHVVRQQSSQLRRSIRGLKREGYRHIYVLNSVEEVEAIKIIQREKLYNNRKEESGPFDIIGDVHGCIEELITLLLKLDYQVKDQQYDEQFFGYKVTHPEGRKAVFVGDLVDRGPDSPAVLKLVMSMVKNGVGICVPGNHDSKLCKYLQGKNVQIRHGLETTIEQLKHESDGFKNLAREFLYGLVSHYVLDDGKLVVSHAGIREEMQGRGSGAVRSFCLYGETTGEIDEFGLPVRYNWASGYRGKAMVVYGHTPVPEAEWLNKTINIDTGCVFGGKLTALRYPEQELVSVGALKTWAEPVRPIINLESELTLQQEDDDVIDIEDIIGKRVLSTTLRKNITIREENSAAALEVISRFAIDPRWLIYLPPTMSPPDTSELPDYLEHPEEVFAYFQKKGVQKVICEEKHMGSRAVVIVCKDEDVAVRRFGIADGRAGVCYTRTGRNFFDDSDLEKQFISRIKKAMDKYGLWKDLKTDWICLDTELMPWSAKAQKLIRDQYVSVGTAASQALRETVAVMQSARSRKLEGLDDLLRNYSAKEIAVTKYQQSYRNYCWPVHSLDDYMLAPFHVLATEGHVHTDKDHLWHMKTIARLAKADEGFIRATDYKVVDLADDKAKRNTTDWWLSLTTNGGEGMVVKPLDFITLSQSEVVQPAIKCRGREYLRIIYGAEYTLGDNLNELKKRNPARKRSLAIREFALGIESLERFVNKEPLRRVHECAFGVLALESEPVDPRL